MRFALCLVLLVAAGCSDDDYKSVSTTTDGAVDGATDGSATENPDLVEVTPTDSAVTPD